MKNHNPLLAALAAVTLIVQATITGQAQALPPVELRAGRRRASDAVKS